MAAVEPALRPWYVCMVIYSFYFVISEINLKAHDWPQKKIWRANIHGMISANISGFKLDVEYAYEYSPKANTLQVEELAILGGYFCKQKSSSASYSIVWSIDTSWKWFHNRHLILQHNICILLPLYVCSVLIIVLSIVKIYHSPFQVIFIGKRVLCCTSFLKIKLSNQIKSNHRYEIHQAF